MYDKIANRMNEIRESQDKTGCFEASDVENYLRHGNVDYLDPEDTDLIDDLLDQFL